jgi:hypothetical protein
MFKSRVWDVVCREGRRTTRGTCCRISIDARQHERVRLFSNLACFRGTPLPFVSRFFSRSGRAVIPPLSFTQWVHPLIDCRGAFEFAFRPDLRTGAANPLLNSILPHPLAMASASFEQEPDLAPLYPTPATISSLLSPNFGLESRQKAQLVTHCLIRACVFGEFSLLTYLLRDP